MFPVVSKLFPIHGVPWRKPELPYFGSRTCLPDNAVGVDVDGAGVEEQVVVGTEAQDVTRHVASVVWLPERTYVCCLCVWASWCCQLDAADLALVSVQALNPVGDGRTPN